MLASLRALREPRSQRSARPRRLWAGAEIDPRARAAAMCASACSAQGVLSKETHDTVVRLAPPLVIARADLDWALDRFEEVIYDIARAPPHPVAA